MIKFVLRELGSSNSLISLALATAIECHWGKLVLISSVTVLPPQRMVLLHSAIISDSVVYKQCISIKISPPPPCTKGRSLSQKSPFCLSIMLLLEHSFFIVIDHGS